MPTQENLMNETKSSLLPTAPDLSRRFLDLLEKTDRQAPDPADLRALRAMLQEDPALWRVAGDLAHTAAMGVVAKMRAYPIVAESLKRGWDIMKDELGYQLASPLERLLVEQVVLCWLHLHAVELEYTHLIGASSLSPDAGHWERRLSSAQARYLRACETLARIRKLARSTPALQVNIAADGGQQVNVAGASLKLTADTCTCAGAPRRCK
jgi:hypothetical protein